MKTLKSTIIVALLAVLVVGCGGVDKILPRQDGTWRTTTITYTNFVGNVADSTWTDPQTYTYVFDKTGSAKFTDDLGTYDVTWYVNPEGDLVTICDNTASTQDCIQYVVQESAKNSQRWKATINGSVNGSWLEIDMSLARVE
jgi:hypothetical protein